MLVDLLTACILLGGAHAQNAIVGVFYLGANCRGEELGSINTLEQCVPADNARSIEVTSISQYCELRGYGADDGCYGDGTTLIALDGYKGCYTFSSYSNFQTVCTQQYSDELANNFSSVAALSMSSRTEASEPDQASEATDLSVFGSRDVSKVDERSLSALMSFGFVLFKFANYAFATLGLTSSCSSYNDSVKTGAQCIFGIVSTLITAGMDIKSLYDVTKGYLVAVQESFIFLSSIQQRGVQAEDDLLEAYAHNFSSLLSSASSMNYSFHGFLHNTSAHSGHLVPEGASKWPVMEITNSQGKFHHTFVPFGRGILHRIAPAPHLSTRGPGYNQEYFTAGSMDSYDCLNPDDLTHQLMPSDFDNILSFVECTVTDVEGTSDIEYQLYDDTIGGTLGSGTIAGANSNGVTRIEKDQKCPDSLPNSGCPAKTFAVHN